MQRNDSSTNTVGTINLRTKVLYAIGQRSRRSRIAVIPRTRGTNISEILTRFIFDYGRHRWRVPPIERNNRSSGDGNFLKSQSPSKRQGRGMQTGDWRERNLQDCRTVGDVWQRFVLLEIAIHRLAS